MGTPNDIGSARNLESGNLPVNGWTRVEKLSLIRREVRETLSPSAFLALFTAAETLIEGGFEANENSRSLMSAPANHRRAFVTVMVTMDLSEHVTRFREPCDEATAHRLGELMHDQNLVHRKLVQLAGEELARITNAEPDDLEVDLDYRVRSEGTLIHLDGDAMTTVHQPVLTAVREESN